jgi:hypothetical protein
MKECEMARYRVAHYPRRNTWLAYKEDGSFYWQEGIKGSHLFPNYKSARDALDTLPDEKLMYGESYKLRCTFMKFYDSNEHFKQEQEYLYNKRLLRSFGY